MIRFFEKRRLLIFFGLSLLGVLWFIYQADRMDEVGFPTDDSWIHQVYARNLAEYGEWSFVPGEPSVASTSPLYSILLAPGFWFGLSPFVWTFGLGVIFLTMLAHFSAIITEQLFPSVRCAGLAAGVLIILQWQLLWAAASGMDVIVFTALCYALIAAGFAEVRLLPGLPDQRVLLHGFGFGLLSGAVTLARPEGVLLVGILGLMLLVMLGLSRRILIWGVLVGGGWALIVLPYLLWNYHVIGQILPSTAEAKISQYAYLREQTILQRYLSMGIVSLAGAQLLAVIGALWGFAVTARRAELSRHNWRYLLPAIWAFAHLTLYVIQLPIPNQNGRYVMPIIPTLLIYATGGIGLMVVNAQRRAVTRVLATGYALSVFLLPIGFLWFGSLVYARQVRAINTEMVAASRWIDQNVPEGDLIAVHDIGALGYFAPKRPVLDMAGLVSPEIVPIIGDHPALMQKICDTDARWLMALPGQRPVPADDPRLTLRFDSGTDYFQSILSITGEVEETVRMRVYEVDCSASE